jgi:hypothetical protein
MGDAEEERRQWGRIHEREKARGRSIQELKRLIDMGRSKRTPKSLLKLAIHGNGIKAKDAAEIIGVKKRVIDGWAKLLESKNLVEIMSPIHTNPTIRPTRDVLDKIEAHRSEKGDRQPRPLLTLKKRGGMGRPSKTRKIPSRELKLEAQLREKDHILAGIEADLLAERKRRVELEEMLREEGQQMQGEVDERISDLEKQLEREHAERMKLEAVLRKKQGELDKYAIEYEEREIAEEDDELDLILDDVADEDIVEGESILSDVKTRIGKIKGDVGGDVSVDVGKIIDEEEQVSRLLAHELLILKKRRVKLIEVGGEGGEGEVDAKGGSGQDSSGEEKAASSAPSEGPGSPIEDKKDATLLVKLLAAKGEVSFKDAIEQAKATEEDVNRWVDELRGEGIIEVKKQVLGSTKICLRQGVEPDEVIRQIRASAVREELDKLKESR